MDKCKMCSEQVEVDERKVCLTCYHKHGLPPYTPPVRRPTPCAQCGHRQLVRSRALRDRAAEGSDHVYEYIQPLSVTLGLKERHTFWAGRKITEPGVHQPMGILEAYVCRKCGFTELYATRPADIPIGDEYGTELIDLDADKDAPYR